MRAYRALLGLCACCPRGNDNRHTPRQNNQHLGRLDTANADRATTRARVDRRVVASVPRCSTEPQRRWTTRQMRIADTNFEDTANADRVTSTAGQRRRSLRGTAGDRRNPPAGVKDRERLIAYDTWSGALSLESLPVQSARLVQNQQPACFKITTGHPCISAALDPGMIIDGSLGTANADR